MLKRTLLIKTYIKTRLKLKSLELRKYMGSVRIKSGCKKLTENFGKKWQTFRKKNTIFF